MRITGTVNFATAQQDVWHHLINPQHLSGCTPNLASWQTLEPEKKYRLLLVRELSQTRQMQIPVEVEWSRVRPPQHLRLVFNAFVGSQEISAEGNLHLTAVADSATALDFSLDVATANVMVVRLLTTLAPKYIDSFFKCLKVNLETIAINGTSSSRSGGSEVREN